MHGHHSRGVRGVFEVTFIHVGHLVLTYFERLGAEVHGDHGGGTCGFNDVIYIHVGQPVLMCLARLGAEVYGNYGGARGVYDVTYINDGQQVLYLF